jgi:hypothetical protein
MVSAINLVKKALGLKGAPKMKNALGGYQHDWNQDEALYDLPARTAAGDKYSFIAQ